MKRKQFKNKLAQLSSVPNNEIACEESHNLVAFECKTTMELSSGSARIYCGWPRSGDVTGLPDALIVCEGWFGSFSAVTHEVRECVRITTVWLLDVGGFEFTAKGFFLVVVWVRVLRINKRIRVFPNPFNLAYFLHFSFSDCLGVLH